MFSSGRGHRAGAIAPCVRKPGERGGGASAHIGGMKITVTPGSALADLIASDRRDLDFNEHRAAINDLLDRLAGRQGGSKPQPARGHAVTFDIRFSYRGRYRFAALRLADGTWAPNRENRVAGVHAAMSWQDILRIAEPDSITEYVVEKNDASRVRDWLDHSAPASLPRAVRDALTEHVGPAIPPDCELVTFSDGGPHRQIAVRARGQWYAPRGTHSTSSLQRWADDIRPMAQVG